MLKVMVPSDCGNAPRKEFIRDFNISFAKNDTDAILKCMSEDIVWNMIGNKTLEGKDAVTEMLRTMEGEKARDLTIHTIITHGDTAAANGVMKFERTTIAFCDIYKFSGHENTAKIKELTSYGTEIK